MYIHTYVDEETYSKMKQEIHSIDVAALINKYILFQLAQIPEGHQSPVLANLQLPLKSGMSGTYAYNIFFMFYMPKNLLKFLNMFEFYLILGFDFIDRM